MSFQTRYSSTRSRRVTALTNVDASVLSRIGSLLGYFPVARRDVVKLLQQFCPVSTGRELIRVGASNDGGYLIPDDLDGVAALFSPGVDRESSFELFFADRGVDCYLADRSVGGPAISHRRFHFVPMHLGSRTAGDLISLHDWVNRSFPAAGDLVLQMDIEGCEYAVLSATPRDTLRRFRIIVLELHGLHRIFRRHWHLQVKQLLDLLLGEFVVCHIHPNNCRAPTRRRGLSIHSLVEVTFLRRDRISGLQRPTILPHSLDRSNCSALPDYPLDPHWSLQGSRA